MASNTPVQDYIVATSDRRRELRGARWEGLRQGGTSSLFPLAPEMDRTRLHPRFEKGVTFEPHQAAAYVLPEPPDTTATEDVAATAGLTASEKLSVLLQHSAWPIRWEPLNGCGQHRAVPTPGALFPVDLYLIARTRNGPRALYCSPRDLCLLESREVPGDATLEDEDALSLVIVGNLGRCVGIYGGLALWLVALEAGMLQAQIHFVARTLGWRLHPCARHDDDDALRTLVGIGHWSESPMVSCRLSGDRAGSALSDVSARPLETIRPRPHHADADAHPSMRDFVQLAATAPIRTASGVATEYDAIGDAYDTPADSFSILDLSDRRSSGIGNGIARWTRAMDAAVLDALLADIRILVRGSGAHAVGTLPLCVTLVWKATQEAPVRIFDVDPVRPRMTPMPCSEDTLRAAREMCRYNTGILITIGADGHLAGDGAAAHALIDAYLRAGVLSQCMCLAAARNGMTARPFMAYPDDLKNLLMPLEMRALVQILIGFDPHPNPAFPIA